MKQDFKIDNEVYRAIYEIYKTGEISLAEKLSLPGKAIAIVLCELGLSPKAKAYLFRFCDLTYYVRIRF